MLVFAVFSPKCFVYFSENELIDIQNQYKYLIKLCFAILGPIFLLGILTMILVYARQRRRKRILAARSLSFDLDEAYDDNTIIRASATVGDSTLKVGFMLVPRLPYNNKKY